MVKPAGLGAMWYNGPDTCRPLNCTFETTRTREKPSCVAHNLEVEPARWEMLSPAGALGCCRVSLGVCSDSGRTPPPIDGLSATVRQSLLWPAAHRGWRPRAAPWR